MKRIIYIVFALALLTGIYGCQSRSHKCLIPVEGDGGWGFVNEHSEQVIPYQWSMASDFSEGLACVCDENDKYGFIDENGEVVVPCQWKLAEDFSEGLAMVMDANGKCGYIDEMATCRTTASCRHLSSARTRDQDNPC